MKRSFRNLLFVAIAWTALGTVKGVAGDKKETGFDWQEKLAELRERFASSSDATLQQTRIDRAYFTINEDEPDQPPFLNFIGITLRTALDDEKGMKAKLSAELNKFPVPNKFKLRIDGIKFHESPIYPLQDAAIAAFKVNATFNVFFERAAFAADGTLQLHTLRLRFDESTNEKIAKLISESNLAKDLVTLPGGKAAKIPKVVPRNYDWLGARLDLQRKFAVDADTLFLRTRLDDGYLAYAKDRKSVEFHVSGVCIHPPGLLKDTEREKRWQARLSNLIPKVAYDPIVSGIAMLPNPSILWQDVATNELRNDGIFFHLARFDAQGILKAEVKLPTAEHQSAALELVASSPANARLGKIGEKSFTQQTWGWNEVLPKAQKRLSEGDFLQHRTRIDRMFLKYEPTRGEPFLHFDGVSLHPTAVEPVEKLRSTLEESLTGLLPVPLDHKLQTERIRFLTSPIYALQTQAVAKNLDGLLFANGRYDELGRLHIAIVTGVAGQHKEAKTLVEALKIDPGVRRTKDEAAQPILQFSEIVWTDVLNELQHWLARSNDSVLRKSRLDRGFFAYPASKTGPEIQMNLLGIYPKEDAYPRKLAIHLGKYAHVALADQLRAGPITAAPTVQNIDNPATTIQSKVHERPDLDGVRLDDASFDRQKKLVFHGIWNDLGQEKALEALARATLTPSHPALLHGINWKAMQTYDSAALLLAMRTWVAQQDTIDEVWLERFYFDGVGKLRVIGFATRAEDKAKVLNKLPEFIPPLPSKALPGIEPAPMKKAKEKEDDKIDPSFILHPSSFVLLQDDAAFKIDLLKNIAQHLRDNIPKQTRCDGLRIDRCFYDPKGVFRIEGLADHANHTEELKAFLDGPAVPFDRKRQLAKGWAEGRQVVIALKPMMVSLDENLPSLAEFDGLTLTRAHHNPKNELVLSGHAIGDPDPKELAPILKRLLDTHERWQLRASAGVVIEITDKRPANRDLAKKLSLSALHLLQVTIGEAKIEKPYPPAIGWWSHAWPFDDKLPRDRPTDADYDKCLEHLNAALLHDSKNVLAWYLRGYCLQHKKRADLSLRDLRRMAEMEIDDRLLRPQRILDLELVQGSLRQSAFRIEQDAIIQIGDGWTLRVLKESPAAPDTTK